MKTVYDTNRWNEGFKDDILNDMMMNAQKFDDFLINITEHENSVDECVEQLNILLADIFEQYTKSRAFDSVTHRKLWQKLVRCGITGKLLNIIRSMYGKIKSCVKLNGKCSDFFNGQGESLSPFYIHNISMIWR